MAFTSYLVDNDNRFKAALANAKAQVGDLRVAFGLILSDFYKSEQAIFALQGPGQYPPFKNSVVAKKGKKTVTTAQSPYQKAKIKAVGFDYPLLVRSGRLSASLLSSDAPGAVANIGPSHLYFGTSVEYGLFHQSDDPRKKIPLRKFLFIGPEAPQFATSDQMGRLGRWLNILNDSVLRSIKKSGVVHA